MTPFPGNSPVDSPHSYKKPLLFFLFFISGFCGLLYQIIWVRIAFASFGIILPVLSVVISIFMLGLSLGSWIGGKWLPHLKKTTKLPAILFYAMAEIVIGLGAFAVPPLFHISEKWLLPLGGMDSSEYLLFSALVLGFSILPWCLAMGLTFPFMMDYIRELKWRETTSFSFLYIANSLGAMFGTLVTALFLIEALGFSNSLMLGAFCNFSIALISLKIGAKNLAKTDPVSAPVNPSASANELLDSTPKILTYLILFVTGFCSLAMEVTWVRGFTPVFGTTIYSFAWTLAIYLLGTIVGSQWYRWSSARKQTFTLPQLTGTCFLFAFFPIILSDPSLHPTELSLLASLFPICLVLGYLTPKLIDQYSLGNPKQAGPAYAINIFGGITGPLFASYLLLPEFGTKLTLVLLALPFGGLFFICIGMLSSSFFFRWAIGLTGASCTFLSIFYTGSFEDPDHYGKGSLVLKDHTATVAASGEGMVKVLRVNGIGITRLTSITKMMAHLPLAIREEKPKSGLVIALGMGTSLRSMASWGIQVKCIELVPSVVQAMPYFFKDAHLVLKQPNVDVIIDDGRRFLKRTHEKFDAITIDPPPPVTSASTSLLYSREFYEIVARSLNEGGIFQQWFPGGEEKILHAIVRSLTDVFPFVRSYKSVEGWGFHLLASMSPFTTPTAEEVLSRLPASAKRDLMEWAPKTNINDFLNLTLKRELPVGLLLNWQDDSIYISDDRPFNEYYLMRRFKDKRSGILRFIH
jgi:spermidine synthase